MNITVIGGGNIGTLMAAEMAAKGQSVTIYTSKPYKWNREITVYDAEENKLLYGTLHTITNDLAEAVCDADMIFITMPAETFPALAQQLEPLVKAGQIIGIIPGSGGVELTMKKLIDRGCVLFGFQRVHSIARLKEYGKSVYMLGRKSELQIASIPKNASGHIASEMERFFDIPCRVLDNYLAVTLTPSNPILHTSRLYAMFRDYTEGVYYPKNILFYEEWTDESSEVLLACDAELQKLCDALPLELRDVISLKTHYESPDAPSMTRKIRSITAFKGLTSPMLQTELGWIPDFSSRYFVSDFAYGLKVIRDIMMLYEIACPMISKLWDWYSAVSGQTNVFQLDLDRDAFLKLYRM